MTNREKYKEELDKILIKNLAVVDGKPVECACFVCLNCELLGICDTCNKGGKKWLDAEAKEDK